jgi:hypothetical protein
MREIPFWPLPEQVGASLKTICPRLYPKDISFATRSAGTVCFFSIRHLDLDFCDFLAGRTDTGLSPIPE